MESVFSQIGPWIFFLTLGSGMGIPLGIPPAPGRPGHGPLRARRVRLLYHLVGQRRGKSRQQEPGRADAGRAGGAAVRRASRKVDPPLRQPTGQRSRSKRAFRRDLRCHALDPPPSDDAVRLGREDQGQEGIGQGRHGRCPGGGCSGGDPAFPPECPRVLSQPQRGIAGGRHDRRPEMVSRETQGRVPDDDGGDQGFLLDRGRGRRNVST